MKNMDEFEMLSEAAEEAGLEWKNPKTRRVSLTVDGGGESEASRQVSGILWGEDSPKLVLLHGGAQNAHTWDTVAIALGMPLLALDLPGHGHSDWRQDKAYSPDNLAEDIYPLIQKFAPEADCVVGMSLGGLTSLALADRHPELVKKLILVDVTPGVNRAKAEPIIEFTSGPEYFESFEEILNRTIEFNPTRSESSLRRGILNNAKEMPDGRWSWRWDPMREWKVSEEENEKENEKEDNLSASFAGGWEALARLKMPLMLVQGGKSEVVDDEDVAKVLEHQPEAEIVVVPDAGHSIQGDKPLELTELITNFVDKAAL